MIAGSCPATNVHHVECLHPGLSRFANRKMSWIALVPFQQTEDTLTHHQHFRRTKTLHFERPTAIGSLPHFPCVCSVLLATHVRVLKM